MSKSKRPSEGNDLSMIYGKIPPQHIQIEQSILGILMLEPRRVVDAKQILKPEDFYRDAHKHICKAIFDVDSETSVDLMLVVEHLRRNDLLEQVGGVYGVSLLTNGVVSSTNLEAWCHIVKQLSLTRKIIGFSAKVIDMSYDQTTSLKEVQNFAEQVFYEINAEMELTRNITLSDIAFNVVKNLFDVKPEDEHDTYTYTGIHEWDEINGPLFNGVYVIAARPAMGKTAWVIELLKRMCKQYPVGLINGEMSDEQISKRFISNIMQFDNDLFKKRASERTEEEMVIINQGLEEFTQLKLFIDSETIEIDNIVSKLRFWKQKFGIRAAVIDFLQILDVESDKAKYMTDVQKLNYILERLRIAAKKIGLPIFVLSQLNRELYKRGGAKEPGLSDLKGSGKIEEIAYQIAFLHRPEYYGIMEDETGEDTKGLAKFMIQKHRDGKTGTLKFNFKGQYSRFDTWNNFLGDWKPIKSGTTFNVEGTDDVPF